MSLQPVRRSKGWSDEEAAKEFGEKFPRSSLEDAAVVCEDCYNEIMKPR